MAFGFCGFCGFSLLWLLAFVALSSVWLLWRYTLCSLRGRRCALLRPPSLMPLLSKVSTFYDLRIETLLNSVFKDFLFKNLYV